MNNLPKIGVAIFQSGDPHAGSDNYACEHGGIPFSFATVSELPSQVLWVTNATLDTLISYGLHKNPKLAHDGYFRTRFTQMSQELGLENLSGEQQAAFLSQTLGNAAEMMRTRLGFIHFPSNGIAQAVGQMFGTAEAHHTTPEFKVAEQAGQRFTAAERSRRFENAEIFSFWFPRYAWAHEMLSNQLPTEQLSSVPKTSLPYNGSSTEQTLEWAIATQMPIFARIKINALDDSLGKLINYGAGATEIDGAYSARNMREWCALPELTVLAQAGDIDILQVAVASGWRDHGLRLISNKYGHVSYSYGLVAENLWCGLMRSPSGYGKISKTLATAWLQAYERMRLLIISERLINLGFEVINYGSGRITVACPPALKQMIPQVALENGLMYPASIEGLTPIKGRADDPAHIMQNLIVQRDYGKITNLDQTLLQQIKN